MSVFNKFKRSKSDPRILKAGPSSLSPSDRLARNLGWFSIGLGVVELFAARRLTGALGMQGQETLVRLCGLREIGSGIMTLSVDKELGLASRIAGDGLDIVTLGSALHDDNPKRENVAIALIMVAGVTLLDIVATAAKAEKLVHQRGQVRDYKDRSGLPRGVSASRGLAKLSSPGLATLPEN
jgi:hypothetical protein